MTNDQLIAFCAFAAISSITPGPNNTMVLASGLNHGFHRSLPHIAGISIGFAILVLGTGAGLHAIFTAVPPLQTVLKYGGALYLVWLAWKLARSGPMQDSGAQEAQQPMSFFGAAAFQWINPKAWVMAVGAVTTYLPHAFGLADALLLAAVYGAICAPCVAAWAGCGVALRSVLQNPRSLRMFNLTAAALLVASLYPMLRS
jgi:threonine/homoserine/homoserine lactone efflux protein